MALLIVMLNCPAASAHAWMIKHGFAKCGTCHTDPSGGETLTHMGRFAAEHLLSSPVDRNVEPRASAKFLFGALDEPGDVRLGGSYRHLFVYTASDGEAPSSTAHFPMQLDVYGSASMDLLIMGGSLGVARGIEGSAHVRGAQLNRELGEGWLVVSRSHFVGLRLDPQTLLRVGRLNLPFGLRVPEHVLWAREATRTDRESDQQHGVALAHADGRLRCEGMAIVGNFQLYPDRYRERGYSGSLEYMLSDTSAVGLSSLVTRSNEDRFTQRRSAVRHAHGLHARLGVSRRWALLAEADVLKEAGRAIGYTALAQADYEPLRGLHLMLTGEALDQGSAGGGRASSPGNGEPRLGAWVSMAWYVLSHLELRLDAVMRRAAPLSAQAQLHLFL